LKENKITKSGFHSKGNLILPTLNLSVPSFGRQDKNKLDNLILKKLFTHLQRTRIMSTDLMLIRWMTSLKILEVVMKDNKDWISLGNVVIKFRALESIQIIYFGENDGVKTLSADGRIQTYSRADPLGEMNLNPEQKTCRFFSQLHKLTYLKNVTFVTSYQRMHKQSSFFEKDFRKFYSKPHNFCFHVKIYACWQIPAKNTQILMSLFNAAECVIIEPVLKESKSYSTSYSPCHNKDSFMKSSQEKFKLMLGKKNIVDLINFSEKEHINVRKVLSYCNSIQSLYIKSTGEDISWFNYSRDYQEIQGFQSLKHLVLDFSFFQLGYYGREVGDPQEVFHDETAKIYTVSFHHWEQGKKSYEIAYYNNLRMILSDIQEECESLQDISVFLCIAKIDASVKKRQPEYQESCKLETSEKLNLLVKELFSFNKIKRFELCSDDNLNIFPLEKLLTSKSLEAFGIKFCCPIKDHSFDRRNKKPQKPKPVEWDSHFSFDQTNQLKEIGVNIPTIIKAPICETNFLNYIGKLENLQIVELVDESCQSMTLDLIYGVLMGILNKKTLRRVIICTNVVNELYCKEYRDLFLQEINTEIEEMENMIFEELKTKIKDLMKHCLEEIMIGRFQGYDTGDIIFYQKNLPYSSEKLFWTENEMNGLLVADKNLAILYHQYFEIFKAKDAWRKEESLA